MNEQATVQFDTLSGAYADERLSDVAEMLRSKLTEPLRALRPLSLRSIDPLSAPAFEQHILLPGSQVVRLLTLASEVGRKLERVSSDDLALNWFLEPSPIFGGVTAFDAVQTPTGAMDGISRLRLSRDFDRRDDCSPNFEKSGPDPSLVMLWTASHESRQRAGRLRMFAAVTARPEEAYDWFRARMGSWFALGSCIRAGFDPNGSCERNLVSSALASMLSEAERNPSHMDVDLIIRGNVGFERV